MKTLGYHRKSQQLEPGKELESGNKPKAKLLVNQPTADFNFQVDIKHNRRVPGLFKHESAYSRGNAQDSNSDLNEV